MDLHPLPSEPPAYDRAVPRPVSQLSGYQSPTGRRPWNWRHHRPTPRSRTAETEVRLNHLPSPLRSQRRLAGGPGDGLARWTARIGLGEQTVSGGGSSPSPDESPASPSLNWHRKVAARSDKKQVIFQGPPGTGKTYVAQALAEHLAGSKRRPSMPSGSGYAGAATSLLRVRGLRAGLPAHPEQRTGSPGSSSGTGRCCGPRGGRGKISRTRSTSWSSTRSTAAQPRQGARRALLPARVPRQEDSSPVPQRRGGGLLPAPQLCTSSAR